MLSEKVIVSVMDVLFLIICVLCCPYPRHKDILCLCRITMPS